jgi:hypothetical protein
MFLAALWPEDEMRSFPKQEIMHRDLSGNRTVLRRS